MEGMLVTEITDEGLFAEPEYHTDVLEHVLYEIADGFVYVLHVWPADPKETREGTASCEKDNGCLDFLIEQHHKRKPQDGYYIAPNSTCEYSKDYWGEVDVDFEGDEIRPAVLSEIPDKITLRIFWNQLKLAWKHAQHWEL